MPRCETPRRRVQAASGQPRSGLCRPPGHQEQHLATRCGELCGAQYEGLLYDLTSPYVEGLAAAKPQMRRGYSRDHRPDCVQVVLALVVSPDGFPLAYEVFDGNRTDVTKLDDILQAVEATYGQAQRVWVLDRGIVSEKKLAILRARAAHDLVGTPPVRLKAFEHDLLAAEWHQVQPEEDRWDEAAGLSLDVVA